MTSTPTLSSEFQPFFDVHDPPPRTRGVFSDPNPLEACYDTLQIASDSARAADQARRDELNAYRDRLGVTLRELAEPFSHLYCGQVSYWTARAWTSGQDSRRARLTPYWPINLLNRQFSAAGKGSRPYRLASL